MYRIQNTESKSFKRMVVMSDMHCGHNLGLTPPSWQYNINNDENSKIAERQAKAWRWYTSTIRSVGKNVDILVVNGDLIDGAGKRSGGAELLTTDCLTQCKIATECLREWNAENIFITRGTPYHSGSVEQFEDVIANTLDAHIDNNIDIKVNGKLFNFRHKVGSSSVPYGKSTQAIKEAIWNMVKSSYIHAEPSDVIIRSHVHYMNINQDSMRYSITTPALQLNSRYGQQQCSGITDFGFLIIDIYSNGHIDIKPYIADMNETVDIIEV